MVLHRPIEITDSPGTWLITSAESINESRQVSGTSDAPKTQSGLMGSYPVRVKKCDYCVLENVAHISPVLDPNRQTVVSEGSLLTQELLSTIYRFAAKPSATAKTTDRIHSASLSRCAHKCPRTKLYSRMVFRLAHLSPTT